MSSVRQILFRLRDILRRDRMEREFDEEIRFHLERETERHVARGIGREEARRRALRSVGQLERIKEATRSEWGFPRIESVVQDLRYAARSLRKSPLFTATAVGVLALAIGATTAIFSLVRGVLLEPLPYPQPERLVALWEKNPDRDWMHNNAAPANFLDWRHQASSFEGITAHSTLLGWALTGEDSSDWIHGVDVYPGFFEVLGVEPILGRSFVEEDVWTGAEPVVVLGHDRWERRFGGDPAVVGRTVSLDGVAHRVVGVAAAGFRFPADEVDLWATYRWDPEDRPQVWFRRAHFVKPVARLAPGVSMAAARAELEAIAARLEREYPETNTHMGAGLTPLREWIVGDVRTPLLVLFGAAGLVLLVACANVANLLLVRGTVRGPEIALRTTLGASRLRVARQLLAESLMLALAGGAAGLALGLAGARLLALAGAEILPRQPSTDLDGGLLLFALTLVVATALLFGSLPAALVSRHRLAATLRSGTLGRSQGAEARRVQGRDLLVVAEIALAVVLVVGAGLTLRSFASLVDEDLGFATENALVVNFELPSARYPEAAQVVEFWDAIRRRIGGLPGVVSVGLASDLPLEGSGWTSDFVVEGWPPDREGIEFNRRLIDPGYFRTMGVDLRGRAFGPEDDRDAVPVAIVNRTLAERYFSGEDPIGRRLAFQRTEDGERLWRTIVGVAADESLEGPGGEGWSEILLPLRQIPERHVAMVARTASEPLDLLPAVRSEVAALDPHLPLFRIATLEQMTDRLLADERFVMLLLSIFSAVVLILAAVGIYGVTAFLVSRRTREIGIRMALGAGRGGVLGLFLRRALLLTGAGLGTGVAASLLLTGTLEGLLHGVTGTDPLTFATATLLLAATAIAATWLPARRAASMDPVETLASE